MKSQPVMLYVCALIVSALLGGCTASSELGDEDQKQSAVRQDTTTVVPPAVMPAVSGQTNRQGFTTKEDTIEVESAQKNRRPEHTQVIVQRRAPAATSFGVQIGAFKAETNALRAKAVLGKRYNAPASLVFDDALKLYRVFIGKFATQREALKFAAKMKEQFPKEYEHAWVVRRTE
jgi:cell division protein FtsN